ncbi:MAG TPA: sigma-70 family RNA polymerase sigma factor [Candidatus Eremiobacteraceae bacterium]|nr:sigma-70 family RNA polymerase sigma factor [Candidatus Eremiobacteraceae bacterium]
MHAANSADAQLESEWLRQTAHGDRAAFERLFRAYEHRLYRFLLGLVREPQVAEELTGDVMLEVWKNAARFRGQSKVSTWIFGIAHHKAVDALRRRAPAHVDLEELSAVPDAGAGPEAQAMADSARRALADALLELTPEHRAVLELTFTNGCSQAEIAAIVGCPVNTVKTRVFYAKQQLRRIFERRGVRRDLP